MEEDAQVGPVVHMVAVAEAGSDKQVEDPLLQEAEVQTKHSPARKDELCGLELQAHRQGEHVEEGQMQMLGLANKAKGVYSGRSDLRREDLT